ncbi:LppU/SCO3897 family protein [Kitasatospora arboriphila]|uniref:LppU/SCO3897 family protein n=1 Tax=Kitasatospora arboriphila TaxID=258052 RepID=UPI0031D9DCD1
MSRQIPPHVPGPAARTAETTPTDPSRAVPRCEVCGSGPAAEATFRGHQAFFLLMRFPKAEGPFCRNCGTAVHRSLTARTLWQGWTGIFSLAVNPVVLLINLLNLRRIRRLPVPVPVPGTSRAPLSPGRPLLLRVELLGLLIPALIVGAFAWDATTSTDYAAVGDCIHRDAESALPGAAVVDCTDREADFRVVARFDAVDPGVCAAVRGSEASLVLRRGRTDYTLCLGRP